MSRQLPPRASLEFLKKEAKELLDALRQQDPAVQLSDAQHALACEYGFASWPKLKSHVEAPSDSPFAGNWEANVSKSTRHPLRAFQRATIRIDVAGDIVRIDHVVIDESGREERVSNTIHTDGQERSFDHGYTMSASWRGRNVLETVAKQNGQPAGWGKYEVSPDGTTLTISADQQVIVCDRR